MKRRWVLTVLAFGVLPWLASAQTARDLIEAGNADFAAGNYASALEQYEQAMQTAGPLEQAELLHNRAAAHFKLGDVELARDLWTQIKTARDAAFEARTRYNLGNCDYADALSALQEQDTQKALDHVAAAREQYKSALRLDPSLNDARANLELAQVLRKQIEEIQQQQQQQQDGQQGEQGDEQKQQQGQQQQGDNQEQQDGEQQPQDGEQQQQQGDQQEQQQSDSQQQQQESGDEQQQQPQQQEQEGQDEQQSPQPQQSETQPAGEEQPQPAEPIEMTKAQAERLLQMVRDAEKARREMLAKRQQAAHKPVERDW